MTRVQHNPVLPYLKEYLEGEARLFVENLELTDANYEIAIDQLKATYGKERC